MTAITGNSMNGWAYFRPYGVTYYAVSQYGWGPEFRVHSHDGFKYPSSMSPAVTLTGKDGRAKMPGVLITRDGKEVWS